MFLEVIRELLLLIFVSASLCPVAFFWPCSQCCGPCLRFNDAFNSTLGANWTQVAGSWSVSGGQLEVATSGAMIIEDTVGSDLSGNIQVNCTLPADGSIIRIIGGYQDSSNYVYGELEIVSSATKVRVGQVLGGVDTVMKESDGGGGSIGSETSFRFCWDAHRLTAFVGENLVASYAGPVTIPGYQGGLATLGTAGTFKFNVYNYYKNFHDSSDCDVCIGCADACREFPDTLEVDVPIGTFSDSACMNCAAANGLFVLNRHTGSSSTTGITLCAGGSAPFQCPGTYSYTAAGICTAGGSPVTLTIVALLMTAGTGSSWVAQVHVQMRAASGACSYRIYETDVQAAGAACNGSLVLNTTRQFSSFSGNVCLINFSNYVTITL